MFQAHTLDYFNRIWAFNEKFNSFFVVIGMTSFRLFFILLFSLLTFLQVQGQEPENAGRQVLQFTGVVMKEDSNAVIPGVHIYLPKNGRGTTSNPYGFFSLPVRVGDSIIFSAVGFKRAHYIVPSHGGPSSLKVIVTLAEDLQFLEEVRVLAIPTEDQFKRMILTADVPLSPEEANMQAWLRASYLRNNQGYEYFGAMPNANYRYVLEQQNLQNQNQFGPRTTNYLNPFAWASFIRSLRGN